MSRCLIAILAFLIALASPLQARDDDAYEFVAEYVRELGTMERLRESAGLENNRNRGNNTALMVGCVRTSERFQLELAEYSNYLTKFKLRADVQAVTSGLSKFYEIKGQIWREIGETCSAILRPEQEIDSAKLAANAPKLAAQLEYLDKSIFQTVPLVFAALMDPKLNSDSHISHLVITKAQRDALIESINMNFGKKLDAENLNYTVSAASVLRAMLLVTDYRYADER